MGHRPTERTVSQVLDYVERKLPSCREKWWAFRGSTGLDGRWAEVSPAGVVRLPLTPPQQPRRVARATYSAAEAMVRLVLDDGSEHVIRAG